MIQVLAAIAVLIMFGLLVNKMLKSKRIRDKQAELEQVEEDDKILSIEEDIVELELALKKRRDLLKQKEGEAKDVK